MNKLKITTIALSTFFLFSCNQKVKTEAAEKVETEMHDEHNHDHSEEISIQLNEGQKWKVDDNMMVHIQNMEKDVASVAKENPGEYQLLSEKLKKNLDLLTSNCTMTGQSHDELHKWLVPYIDLVDEFSEGKSKEQLTKVEESLITFNTYFK
jgi:hypothetical protein